MSEASSSRSWGSSLRSEIRMDSDQSVGTGERGYKKRRGDSAAGACVFPRKRGGLRVFHGFGSILSRQVRRRTHLFGGSRGCGSGRLGGGAQEIEFGVGAGIGGLGARAA